MRTCSSLKCETSCISFSFINYAAHCQAWLSYGKDCGRGNERLDAKALAVYHVAEGEEGGSKIP